MDTGYDSGLPPQSPLALAKLGATSHLLTLLCAHREIHSAFQRAVSPFSVLSVPPAQMLGARLRPNICLFGE